MRGILISACGLTLFPCFLAAQEGSLWSRVHIRQNLNTKQEVAQPAFLQFTDPKGKDSSFAVGIGLRYDAVATKFLELGPFVEYQRNTLVDKEQNVFKGGLSLVWQAQCIDPTGKACGAPNDNSGFLLSNINYKRDSVKDDKAAQVAVFYTHAWVGKGKRGSRRFPLPNLYFPVGRTQGGNEMIGILYSPNVGLEFDQIYEAKAPEAEGDVLRGVFDVSVLLMPAPQFLDNSVELSLRGVYRTDFSDSTNQKDDDHPLFVGALTYYFLKGESPERKAGISLAYTDGEDPTNGFEDQSFWRLALTFQVE